MDGFVPSMNQNRPALPADRFRRVLQPCLVALFLACSPGWTEAEPSGSGVGPGREAAASLDFARELLSIGEHERAAHEFLRCLWLSAWDTSAVSLAAMAGVSRAYLSAGEFDRVDRWDALLRSRGVEACDRVSVRLDAATANLRRGRPRDAFERLAEPSNCVEDEAFADRITFLRGIAQLHLGNWEASSAAFRSVPPGSSLYSSAAEYGVRALQGAALPRKSAKTAGWLGMIPGLGYLYCGLPQTAVAALVVTATFAEGAREAFRSDQTALGVFLAAFGGSWYSGSIYGSVKSAGRVNMYHRDRFLYDFTY